LKFTDAGEVMLTAGKNASAEPGRIDFAVADTGVGIPQEKLATIFEAFNQVESSTNRKYGGTGLGLPISRRLVEQMGGQLTVTSAPQKGSTFSFSVQFELPARSERGMASETAELWGRRVLVISSNAHQALVLDEILRSWGMETRVFAAPLEAFTELSTAKASERTFSLAIVDDRMPSEERARAAQLVQRSAPGVPILLLASDFPLGSGDRKLDAGIAASAVKPVRRSELLRLVRDLVQGRQLRASQPPPPRTTRARGKIDPRRALKVLVADDSPENRLLVDSYLRGGPFLPVFVEDGQSAVDRFLSGHFDLILMDMQMPVMDGLSATRAIREAEQERGLRPIPVIALTASARPEDISKSQQAGCNAHLSKPVSKRQLLDALSEYVQTASDTPGGGVNRPAQPAVGPDTSDMPDELKALIPDYVRAMKQYAGEMSSLLEAENFDSIRSVAHNIKGTGASYGFPELTHLAAALENSAKTADAGAVTWDLVELAEFLERVPIME